MVFCHKAHFLCHLIEHTHSVSFASIDLGLMIGACYSVQEKHEVGLTPKMFAEGLSLLCKTGDGLSHAFVRFDATHR